METYEYEKEGLASVTLYFTNDLSNVGDDKISPNLQSFQKLENIKIGASYFTPLEI